MDSSHHLHQGSCVTKTTCSEGICELAEPYSDCIAGKTGGSSRFEASDGAWPTKMWRDRLRVLDCFGLFRHATSRSAPMRVYQVWPGKNVFFFRGRIICGPDPRGFLVTTVAIVLSDWIFCTHIADVPPKHSVAIFTASVILTTIAIVSLVLTSTRDAGIIPRNVRPPSEAGTNIARYCKVCMILRPPRSCHCAVCDNCVEKFDHHCPWIGQCIGLRNYRYYMVFLLSALVFFVYMFGFSCWRIVSKISKSGLRVCKVLLNIPETLALALFSFVAIWFLGGLAIFHVYLIILNQTAHENFKKQYVESPNPYNKGMLQNIKEALFVSLPPSRLNFRAVAEPLPADCVGIGATPTEDACSCSNEAVSLMHGTESPKSPQDSHLVEMEL